MALTNEDLLAISQLLDTKLDARLQPIENRLKRIEVDLLENNVIPRLNTIESCYTDTYNRYKDYADKMEAAFADIELLKKVVSEHSEKLQKISQPSACQKTAGYATAYYYGGSIPKIYQMVPPYIIYSDGGTIWKGFFLCY